MRAYTDKTPENKSQSMAKTAEKPALQFLDASPEATFQRKLQQVVNNSSMILQMRAFQELAGAKETGRQDVRLSGAKDNLVTQLAHYTSGGPVYMDDDDPTSELLDDNFDETIKDHLTQPTADGTVAEAVEAGTNIDVVLWRSTTGASVAAIQAAGSAGGAAVQQDVAAPGHEVQQDQIAVGGVVPEYTASRDVTGFSWRHWLVVIRINTRYLARGSGSESGWICSPAAPVVVLDTVDRTMGLPEPAGLGAA